DILQASFIKAYQHLGEVRGRFDAWVFRIVANSCKDWLKNIRRTHVSYDEDDQPSTYSTPEEEMDRNELRTDLQFALARLAPSLREAFVMKHVEGRSYEELWTRINAESEMLRRRVTPVGVQQRIMASLPDTPGTGTSWWKQQLTLTPVSAIVIAVALLAVGALIIQALR